MRGAKFGLLLFTLAEVIALSACGGSSSTCQMCGPVVPPKAQHFVYTANAAGNPATVSALSASPSTGALTPISGSPYNTGSGSRALAADPTGGRIYVANSLSGDISAFTFDHATGAMNQIAASIGPEDGVDSIVIPPTGGFAYAVSGSSANLWAFSINTSGGLMPLGSPIVITPATANSSAVVMDPTGKYLYTFTADSGSTSIYGFSRDNTTRVLTPLSGFPLAIVGLGNQGTFDRTGNFLLVTGTDEFGTAGGVEVFSLNSSNGALTLVSGPVQVRDDPAGSGTGTCAQLFPSKWRTRLNWWSGSGRWLPTTQTSFHARASTARSCDGRGRTGIRRSDHAPFR